MLTQLVIEPVNKWKGDRLKDRKKGIKTKRQLLWSSRLQKVRGFFLPSKFILWEAFLTRHVSEPRRGIQFFASSIFRDWKHGRTQRGWYSASVITPQLNKQFVVLYLEWLTNDLLVVVLSEPPWAVWGLIYMIIGCFDDTLVIISTDWSSSKRWFGLTSDFDFWRFLNGEQEGCWNKVGCFCTHAGISVHPETCTTSLPPWLPLSAQQCSAEPPDYSYFSSNSQSQHAPQPGKVTN